jgi:hypothetical protein
MYRLCGSHFGVMIEPGPSETDQNVPVTFQILTGSETDDASWRPLGPKFPAEHMDDLIVELKKAKQVLNDQFLKRPEGYRTRRAFF